MGWGMRSPARRGRAHTASTRFPPRWEAGTGRGCEAVALGPVRGGGAREAGAKEGDHGDHGKGKRVRLMALVGRAGGEGMVDARYQVIDSQYKAPDRHDEQQRADVRALHVAQPPNPQL